MNPTRKIENHFHKIRFIEIEYKLTDISPSSISLVINYWMSIFSAN